MSPSVKVLLSLFCAAASVVCGVKLPGSCPQVPATHKFNTSSNFMKQELVLSVPFTDPNTTNLFKDINTRNAKSYAISYHPECIDLTVRNPHPYNRYWFTNVIEYSKASESDSFNLKSRIYHEMEYSHALSCHELSEVNVRSWFDGEFVIIWSCRENSNIDHEEAVILMVNIIYEQRSISYYENLNEYLEMIKRLNKTMRKLLTGPLLNKIEEKWTQEPEFGESAVVIEKVFCTNITIETNPITDWDIVIFSVFISAPVVIVGVLIWKAVRA